MKERGKIYEEMFAEVLDETGYEYERQVPVRIEKPVKNKNGEIRKTVAVIDFCVSDRVYVEISKGKGDTPHKRAQFRVLDKAGVQKLLVSSNKVIILDKSPMPYKKRFLEAILGF